jgi:hypothetical protein
MKRFAMKLMVPRGENDDLVDRGIRREGSESESENRNRWHVTYPPYFHIVTHKKRCQTASTDGIVAMWRVAVCIEKFEDLQQQKF